MRLGVEKFLSIAPEVAAAVDGGQAVVALESTLLAHGLPWPDNIEVALQAEQAVRESRAVPATIAVLTGSRRAITTPPAGGGAWPRRGLARDAQDPGVQGHGGGASPCPAAPRCWR